MLMDSLPHLIRVIISLISLIIYGGGVRNIAIIILVYINNINNINPYPSSISILQ